MINSMTAFARSEQQTPQGALSWEIKAVNQRHLDCHLRLPEELRGLEPGVREQLAGYLSRGKIECQLRFQLDLPEGTELAINQTLATQLAHASRAIDAVLYNPSPVSSLELMKWPGVLEAPQLDIEQLQGTALNLLDEALQQLVANRQREGTSLQLLIEQRAETIQQQIDIIRQRMPQVRQAFATRLQQRLADLKQELDPARLEQEVVLLVQKSDIDEELDRLEAHLKELAHTFKKGGVCGRRLDFLMQEFNREANTIASKSASVTTSKAGIELKVVIEQMREQIQNIE